MFYGGEHEDITQNEWLCLFFNSFLFESDLIIIEYKLLVNKFNGNYFTVVHNQVKSYFLYLIQHIMRCIANSLNHI